MTQKETLKGRDKRKTRQNEAEIESEEYPLL
jgi:hypothetical protein